MFTLSLLHHLVILAFPFKSIHRKFASSSAGDATPSTSSSSSDGGGGRGDCAICLAAIAGGEETGDLRCRHAFHKLCFDQWLENRGRTCPLCRDYIRGEEEPSGAGSGGAELIVFYPFDDFGCDDDWWIR